jgi:hypothetical protein
MDRKIVLSLLSFNHVTKVPIFLFDICWEEEVTWLYLLQATFEDTIKQLKTENDLHMQKEVI